MCSGTSYAEFVASVGLPKQLSEARRGCGCGKYASCACADSVRAQVDPIVASFTGGAVGVLSMLLLVEVNNAKVRHARSHCHVMHRC